MPRKKNTDETETSAEEIVEQETETVDVAVSVEPDCAENLKTEVQVDNSFGPRTFQRDEFGLLKNVQYKFNEDGSVNWRGMVSTEYLVPNSDWFKRKNQPVPSSAEGLDDSQVLILLAGIKQIAKLRGYSSVQFIPEHISEGHATVKCKICWLPNYETGGEGACFEELANASYLNTNDFGAKFLEAIAANRAFVRAVRNFLGIDIVGADEIDKNTSAKVENPANHSNADTSASGILKNKASQLGYSTYADFKEKLRELWASKQYQNAEAANWTEFSDIPAKEARKLLGLV